MSEEALVRIGELARRAGIPPPTLRAWERRYGIVEPRRTEGGYRLYSAEDERRLRAMVDLITGGVAPAEAAARVTAIADSDTGAGACAVTDAEEQRRALIEALVGFDEGSAHAVLDAAVAAYSTDALLTELVLPTLREAGERWHRDEITVGQEHFATNLIRGRVMALTRGWGGGEGPLGLLACPPGELHDLGLACFGLMLRRRGWRVAFLGTDTPLATLGTAAERTSPDAVVLALTSPDAGRRLAGVGPILWGGRLLLAGAAATPALASELGAELIEEDIAAAADHLAVAGPASGSS